jgi:uncharacterized membrane-anchored protein
LIGETSRLHETHPRYLAGTAIFVTLFVVAVAVQLSARRFHPFLYWTVIVATTTAGTTLADYVDRSLGIGYAGGATLLFVCLMTTIWLWHRSLGSVSVATIRTRSGEAFYWATIMFSQTLGTALGDWMAADTGLGYEGGALVFAATLAIVAFIYFRSKVSRTFLFWAAFILTRPLGATLGDLMDKPLADGDLAWSRYAASTVLAVVIVLCVSLLPQREAASH